MKARDWDGLVIVADRSDLLSLLQNWSPCATLLGVEQDELQSKVCSRLHNLSSVDGVRFSGYTSTGLKKSVKIVHIGCLADMVSKKDPSYINILSAKDIRVYQNNDYLSSSGWAFQFVTSLLDGTCVLHDPDIYCTNLTKTGVRYARYGITIDEFLSGQWVYFRDEGSQSLIKSFSSRFLKKYEAVSHIWIPSNWELVFAKSERFSHTYRERLKDVEWAPKWIPSPSSKAPQELLLFFGPPVLDDQQKTIRTLGHVGYQLRDTPSAPLPFRSWTQNLTALAELGATPFCQNRRGITSIAAPNVMRLFWKESENVSAEILGAQREVTVYQKTQFPCYVDFEKKLLFYPWFEGKTVSELRLSHATGAEDLSRELFSIEMVRAEDILRGLLSTLSTRKADSRIQKYYRDRLLSERV